MTRLLQEAFKRASELPEDEQNVLAKWLLEELQSDREWDRLFAESPDVLERLAQEAREAHRQGKTTPLDFDRL